MRTEQDIRKLKERLDLEIDDVAGTGGRPGRTENAENVDYWCNVNDALDWVLEDTSTEDFVSEAYLRLPSDVASPIESPFSDADLKEFSQKMLNEWNDFAELHKRGSTDAS